LRPLYLIRNKELTEIKGDSHSIGGYFENISNVFTEHEIDMQPMDMVYIFSDGYCDQFGEETNKKFSTRRFKELVVKNSDLPMMDQHENLISTLWQWKGEEKQIDDILVIGIQI
jgi:serine phosphatase RsbU (regulator of sigma subunit)